MSGATSVTRLKMTSTLRISRTSSYLACYPNRQTPMRRRPDGLAIDRTAVGRRNGREDEGFARREVDERARDDRDEIGDDWMQEKTSGEDRHDRDVADERDRAIQQVEASQPGRDLAARSRGPIAPGPALMPEEVVEDGGLHRKRRRGNRVQAARGERRQRDELHAGARHADEVEGKRTGAE